LVCNGIGTVIAYQGDSNGLRHDDFLSGKKRGYSKVEALSKGELGASTQVFAFAHFTGSLHFMRLNNPMNGDLLARCHLRKRLLLLLV